MDFQSKRRRDLLALLLSVSATTCSAPQDDHTDVAPDPPNVAAAPPTAAAQTQCEWESGFRISEDSIGPLAITDPVGVVMELCPQARYEFAAHHWADVSTGRPMIVIPIPGGELSGMQPRRPSRDGLGVEQPVNFWYLTGDGTLPEGIDMKSTLGDLKRAYGPGSASVIDGSLSYISVGFARVRGIWFYMENLDMSALVQPDVYEFDVLFSSVPDSATIRGISFRGAPYPRAGG